MIDKIIPDGLDELHTTMLKYRLIENALQSHHFTFLFTIHSSFIL